MFTREQRFDLVDSRFSGERAKQLATKITQYGRSPGSSGYHAATDLAAEELRHMPLDSFEVSDYPIDDAWEVTEASLDVVSPEPIRLIDLETAGMCVASYSDSTLPGGEVLEVVDVGTGETPTHFDCKDVAGKVVFIHGTTRRPGWWEASSLALRAGARGIITDYMLYQTPGVRTPELVPEAAQLLRLQVRNAPIWAFSIPHRSSVVLKDCLSRGSVKVRAHAVCRNYKGTGKNVAATIKGTDLAHEELLFCAHTSGTKPGGNCAAGVGLVVELARTLASLIEEGALPRPRRSIKFLLVIEAVGPARYLAGQKHRMNDIIAAFTYCSSGNDQCKTKSALCLFRSPDSVPSYINDYLVELMKHSPKDAKWAEIGRTRDLPLVNFVDYYYTPWSDNNRFAAHGLPAPLFMSWPDRYFHSQLLTADVIDPQVIRRCALVAAVSAIELGSAGLAEASAIARTVAAGVIERLAGVASKYRGDSGIASRASRHIAYLLRTGEASISSVSRLSPGNTELEAAVTSAIGQIRSFAGLVSSQFMSGTDPVTPYHTIVPRRLTSGAAGRWSGLSYQELLSIGEEMSQKDPGSGFDSLRVVADEAWNFIDGKRSVADIADCVGFEFDLDVPPNAIHRILQGLERSGKLEFARA